MITFRITIEGIMALLKGQTVYYNNEVKILPLQKGMFITHDELEIIIKDRTNAVERLLKLMEEQ